MPGAEVTVAGNLTADPVLRRTESGKSVAQFSVAHTERRLNRETNEWENYGETLFLTVNAWYELGENVAASLRKGAGVVVTGSLRSRTFTHEGQERRVVELRADSVSVDLRRQTVSGVMRITRGAVSDADANDGWTPASEPAPSTRREAAAA